MGMKFQSDTEKDRGLYFCLPTFYLKGNVNNNTSWKPIMLAKGKGVKRKGDDHHDSCIRVEDKSKNRPFAERSWGCHALLWLAAQNLNAKERHFILPLVIGTFIMQSVIFITSISYDRIKLIFLTLIDHTYLESNFYCLHRCQLT